MRVNCVITLDSVFDSDRIGVSFWCVESSDCQRGEFTRDSNFLYLFLLFTTHPSSLLSLLVSCISNECASSVTVIGAERRVIESSSNSNLVRCVYFRTTPPPQEGHMKAWAKSSRLTQDTSHMYLRGPVGDELIPHPDPDETLLAFRYAVTILMADVQTTNIP